MQPQLTVLDYPDSHYAGRRLQVEQVEAAKHYLTRDDKVFIVSMTQQGVGWFQLYYEFYPDVDGLKSGATLYRVEGAGADMHFVPLNGEEAAS